ncbi:MAG: hypothetical protein A3I01_02775 [Betaproteobacteria bacterium RIFCSPLOWO2_02_FULL_65_24]|nr:MAG: hypothetical protein A3I01_02775 [Betaproteobacteria bacterium RIFCSPLOWO2_02_FULL_65_24]
MPLSVRLPPRVEQKLADYCVSHKVSKSEAVKRALEQMIEQSAGEASAYELGKRFMGSDRRPGDVARRTKQLLRERFRAK